MLRRPITLSNYSTSRQKRQIQSDAILRMHKEFKPIGIFLSEAVTELTERLPGEVPTYRHMSPTAVVFAHAGELFWVLAVGYALDILPYMAIGLILLAHKQIESDDRPQPSKHRAPKVRVRGKSRVKPRSGEKISPSQNYKHKYRNGKDHDHQS